MVAPTGFEPVFERFHVFVSTRDERNFCQISKKADLQVIDSAHDIYEYSHREKYGLTNTEIELGSLNTDESACFRGHFYSTL